jgi:hypothetical protein
MNRLQEIELRWQAIEVELQELYAGKVHPDPASREAELLLEQDALEYEIGEIQFRLRDKHDPTGWE